MMNDSTQSQTYTRIHSTADQYRGPALLAFIDLLGFTAKIGETWNDETGALERLLSIKHDFENRVRFTIAISGSGKPFGRPDRRHFSKAFTVSDSFVLYEPVEHEGLEVLGSFAAAYTALLTMREIAARHGFAVRGALEFGELFASDRETIGPAFNMAYALESKIAKSSRIIIGPALAYILSSYCSRDIGIACQLGSMIYFSNDGLAAVTGSTQIADTMRALKSSAPDQTTAAKYDDYLTNVESFEKKRRVWPSDLGDAFKVLEGKMAALGIPWPERLPTKLEPVPIGYLDRGRDKNGRPIAPSKRKPPHGNQRGRGKRRK